MNLIRYQIQRRVAISSSIAIALIAILNLIVGLSVRKLQITTLLFHPSVLLLFVIAFVCLLSALKDWVGFRLVHVGFFLGYPLAIFLAIEESPYDIRYLTWCIYGFILCIQYRLIQKRLPHFIAAYMLLFLIVKVIVSTQSPEFTLHAAIGALILLFLFVYLFWVAFAEEMREYMRANDMLKLERDKNLIFVKFGKNIAGVVHNMKSVMMSFSGYSELIDVHDPDGIKRILELQNKASARMLHMIDNFMTAVRSYQKTEVTLIRLNELVVSSIEVSRGNQVLKNRSKFCFELHEPDLIMAKPSFN